MSSSIHARLTPDGMRYREWSSILDAYTTREMSEKRLREYLLADGWASRDVSERIIRTRTRGTSSFVDPERDMTGPWDEERCESGGKGCGGFHHPFQLEHARGGGKNRPEDDRCGWCGERKADKAHGQRCVPANPAK